eukprot:CAMPEP_0177164374 /NCGR_PEP_ID=MMETSP0367-20130122/6910_1 /TAXON_ID=447022 ORGANISM="Scrippsiella hangoei-like, Strain SHHI-4" /NCGR_SAMPLE_ID=MMETSP0367 /ASSEMBLY_ACC=CAM_ASM_000362 /LENGTH=119 /DNA_ID=CAMNT_0018610259 /DNA_START=160 /DNA_END=520 /DNA_ORIENTATION=+
MPTGLVTTWLEDRGFGFIAPDDPDIGDLFVHASELRDARSSSLRRGDRVSFQVKFNRDNGKNLATNVTVEKTAGLTDAGIAAAAVGAAAAAATRGEPAVAVPVVAVDAAEAGAGGGPGA